MRTCYTNKEYFAYVLSHSEQKLKVFDNTAARNDGFGAGSLGLAVDVMENRIIRFVVTGTRCKMTVCWDLDKHEVIRQPRGLKVHPIQGKPTFWKDIDIYWDEIDELVKQNIELRKNASEEAA